METNIIWDQYYITLETWFLDSSTASFYIHYSSSHLKKPKTETRCWSMASWTVCTNFMCFWRVAFSVNVLSQRLHLNVWPPWIDHMWGWRLPLHLVVKSQIGHENASTIILNCLHAEEHTSILQIMQYQNVRCQLACDYEPKYFCTT